MDGARVVPRKGIAICEEDTRGRLINGSLIFLPNAYLSFNSEAVEFILMHARHRDRERERERGGKVRCKGGKFLVAVVFDITRYYRVIIFMQRCARVKALLSNFITVFI